MIYIIVDDSVQATRTRRQKKSLSRTNSTASQKIKDEKEDDEKEDRKESEERLSQGIDCIVIY